MNYQSSWGVRCERCTVEKKGRDLFDLWFLYKSGSLSVEKLLEAFDHYMSMNQMKVRRATF
jgi:hypothetical protein